MQYVIGIADREKWHYIPLDNEESYEISIRKVIKVKENFMRRDQELKRVERM